ncbi:PREDICTED: tetratricopeptide repeat protein 25-like [Dufourea novaeangliae]|uniref:Outer dynein arm-docking complex subunit 4 n=1 Tax=Dufourea novaeangliae TaxID=178035 RepID=A0A154P566_DUFNO|nr:PREDICTED: tetratricopeptide repeat protein 25-like [Dufourea novaeangliae]KZC06270.1 Tetratricopeptide repeat protein 25 [Dufourea novaeangliae]
MALLATKGIKDELLDLNEVRKAVETAENRARSEQKRNDTTVAKRTNRVYARALHREGDQLYHRGDYESALVLYHRAASSFPRDSSHSVAATRTMATINSCNKPSKALRKAVPFARSEERLMASLCPETAAILANDKLKKSPDHASVVEALSYFEDHKSFWKCPPTPRPSNPKLAQTRAMLRQMSNVADQYLRDLESTFNSGRMTISMKVAQELLMVSGALEDPSRYQIAAYHYLSLIHVALKRHDRAVSNVSRLIRLSKSTGNVVQICRSFVTLGKVHLSFGHLNAAARAWKHLAGDLKEPIPVAWIRHEIGRCYSEAGKHVEAMEMAIKCVEAAIEARSTKWLLHGKLLLGQSLARLGRLTDASTELQIAANITEEEGDTPMLSYIRELIDQVACALRRITDVNGCNGGGESNTHSTRTKKDEEQSRRFANRTKTVITTMFAQKRVIMKYRDGGSSSDASVDVDEEITMQTERSLPRSCRDSTARSNLEKEPVGRGGDTFRVEEKASGSSSYFSEESSSSSSVDGEHVTVIEDVEEDLEEIARKTGSNVEDEEPGTKRGTSSTSMKTVNTDVTYVIERRDDSLLGKTDDGYDVIVGKENRERIRKLTGVQMIQDLARKNELELLEMARDLLLMPGAGDRSGDLRDSGDRTALEF